MASFRRVGIGLFLLGVFSGCRATPAELEPPAEPQLSAEPEASAPAELVPVEPKATAAAAPERPSTWARPLERSGLPNLFEVEPWLFRCAQPEREGFRELERMGVRTIVNLRGFHDDDLPRGSTLDVERIRFHTWHPEDEDVRRFLKLVRDSDRRPLVVHCQHGADRTGMMLAIYRIVEQGWSKDDAIREMTEGGYGFHEEWQNLVRYLRGLDVEHFRAPSAP